jgi:hypothetical protein
MTNTTTLTATASFAKLANGSWGIQGVGLVSGQPVTVVKRDGTRQDAVVGTIVDRKYGKVFATIARPERTVVADVAIPARPSDKVTEIGFYLHEGIAYKVVKSGAGRLYAKKVTKNGFVYDGGAIFSLSASELMTAEEVRVYSRTIGICANCSVELSDPVSVEIGLGTHCGPAILGSDNYKAARKAAKLVPAVAEALANIKAEKAAEKAIIEVTTVVAATVRNEDEVADLLAHFGA